MKEQMLKLSEQMASRGYIQEKYIKLYAQGMQLTLSMLLNAITVIFIGVVLGVGIDAVIFLLAFMPLRSYAGGYHAKGYVSCYIITCMTMTILLLSLRYFRAEYGQGILMLFIASFIIVLLLAPLPDANKPVSEEELKQFKGKTRILLVLESILGIGLLLFHIPQGYSVLLAIVMSAMLLVLHCLNPNNHGENRT